MTYSEAYFSKDYLTARARFVEAANEAGAEVSRHPCPTAVPSPGPEVDLSVDIAMVGEGDDLIVVSSGLHGIEGFLGSAVQLALLKKWREHPLQCRLLLIHAINPWGFHNLRRVDDNNVDLNRNYPTGDYTGAPDGYHRLNSLLNPDSAGTGRDWFTLRAAATIARYGMPALKAAVASGQYEYPAGLFFGGYDASCSTRLVVEHIKSWVGGSRRVFHADIHTGLGEYARCKLLIPGSDDGGIARWGHLVANKKQLETHGVRSATAYPVNGMLGDWLLTEFNDRPYYFIGAEVGTYSPLSVLSSLRDENRQHYYGEPQGLEFINAKRNLLEHFCPRDIAWRRQSVEGVLAIIKNAAIRLHDQALEQDSGARQANTKPDAPV